MNIINRIKKYKLLLNKLTSINNGLYVMCYHEIADIDTIYNFAIKKITTDFELFKEHISYYRDNFEIIDYKKAYELIVSKKENNGKYLLLTFDDNYKGVLDNAIPYLAQFDIKPIVFCNNSTFFDDKMLWRVWLGEVYQNNLEYIKGYDFNTIMKKTKNDPKFIKENLWDEYMKYENKKQYFFTFEEYKKSSYDFLVSPHTKNHFMLSKLNNDELETEMIDSSLEFKEKIDNKYSCKFFAYPYGHKGSFEDKEMKNLQDTFEDIIALNDYNISNVIKDKLNYPRINIINESIQEIENKLKIFKF